MGRRRPPETEDPPKPLSEMTRDELDAWRRRFFRTMRDDEIRRGTRRPRTIREVEIWREAQAERAARLARRIARAERRHARASEPDVWPAGNVRTQKGRPGGCVLARQASGRFSRSQAEGNAGSGISGYRSSRA